MIKLKTGDNVTIVAPASQFRGADRGLLQESVSLLESWGLSVRVRVDASHHFYLAGRDLARAGHLNDALGDPDTQAIFCTRGGYGSLRLVDRLNKSLAPTPKILVGHSDITSLHLALVRLWPQLEMLHGPNIATRQLLGNEQASDLNRRSLFKTLFEPETEFVEKLDFVRPGSANGQLVGGCLSLVAASAGSKFSPDTTGAILFLEDTGEAPYKIDRMLTQLRLAGKFDGVAAIVFGVMRGCTDPYNNLRDVLADFFAESSFPVAIGLRSGHGDINLTMRLGALTSVDSVSSEFRGTF